MKISILDQMLISEGYTEKETLENTLKLAKFAEENGYNRFWISEHHGLEISISKAPEIIMAYLLNNTTNLRIGSGAILLNNYSPYKIAEIYYQLNLIGNDRVDLGLGSSFGGDINTVKKLNNGCLPDKSLFQDKIIETIKHINTFLTVNDKLETEPSVWILTNSQENIQFSNDLNLGTCYGHFLTGDPKFTINTSQKPNLTMCVSVICSNSFEKAEILYNSQKIVNYHNQNKRVLTRFPKPDSFCSKKHIYQNDNVIIGTPVQIKEELKRLEKMYLVDEFIILTNVHSFEEKLNSYKLISDILLL